MAILEMCHNDTQMTDIEVSMLNHVKEYFFSIYILFRLPIEHGP